MDLGADVEGGQQRELRVALYESRGLAPPGARQLAESVIANGPLALEVMAREELGIDPDQPGGSPWRAAASSFIMFCLGAFVPLVAFFYASRRPALITSVVLSAIVLLVLGAAVTT
jgi:vacuolar iron transporter family protein